MKTPIAITLIIMGALLVMTPAISDYLYQQNLVTILARPGVTNVNLDGKMSESYRFSCWLTGSSMVGVAVLASLFAGRQPQKQAKLVAQTA